MIPIMGFVVGLFVTLVLIPPLIHVAGLVGLKDKPGGRKIHTEPVPCIGGFGILAGVFLPTLMWLPLNTQLKSYLIGGVVIFILGVWDDQHNLNYKWKLVGQVIAVAIVLSGGILLEHFPFFGFDPVPGWISYPVTALFLLGLTNAINLFDGLDGLAGGCMLLTLCAIASLAYQVGGDTHTLSCLAAMGAILGFLYYNTYPARIFMGDAGAQFLGFTVAIFSILLIEETHTALNPTLPLLLLGLPVLDTLWVLALRLSQGRTPFVGDQQHLHHQLLNFGFTHSGAVSLIYSVHAVMVGSALFVLYQSDLIVVGVFLVEIGIVAGLVYWARSIGWRRRSVEIAESFYFGDRWKVWKDKYSWIRPASTYCVEISFSVFLVFGAIFNENVDRVSSILAFGLSGLMLFASFFLVPWIHLFTRLGVYVVSLLALTGFLPLTQQSMAVDWTIDAYMVILAIILAIGIRFTRRDLFQVTPQDLLVAFFVLAIPNLPPETFGKFPWGYLFLRAPILFYACEYVVSMAPQRYVILRTATIAALVITGVRGWPL